MRAKTKKSVIIDSEVAFGKIMSYCLAGIPEKGSEEYELYEELLFLGRITPGAITESRKWSN